MLHQTPIYRLFFEPRTFFARHASYFPIAWIAIFSAFNGIDRRLYMAFQREVPPEEVTFVRVLVELLMSALFAVAMVVFSSAIFAWAANRLGGSITRGTMLQVLGWSTVPKVLTVFGFAVLIAVQGETFFTRTLDEQQKESPLLIGGFVMARLILSGWAIVIGVVGLSVAGRLSMWRAIGSYVLGGALIAGLIFLWVMVFSGVR